MRRLLPIASILLMLSIATASGFWQQYQRFLQQPMMLGSDGLVIEVASGSTVRSVLRKLEQLGFTKLDWRWRLFNRLQPATIKTGEYSLQASMTPPELMGLLVSGNVISYRFTIVEGWSVKQLLVALDEDPLLVHQLTVTDMTGLEQFPALQ